MSRRSVAAASAVALLGVSAADASITVARDVQRPDLRVDARGYAEVSWSVDGARRTLLVPPRGRVLPGGRLAGRDVSRPTSAVRIPFKRVLRRTPDGRFWALQTWRVQAGGPIELRLSRWRGAPTRLTLAVQPLAAAERLVGIAVFSGRPVAGFSSTPAGKRLRIYAYLDCFACPGAGSGWRRMVGVAPRADGSFTYLVSTRFRAHRYRALLPGPNVGTTFAPDALAVATG